MADNPIGPLTNQEVVKQGNSELRRTVQHLPAYYRTCLLYTSDAADE